MEKWGGGADQQSRTQTGGYSSVNIHAKFKSLGLVYELCSVIKTDLTTVSVCVATTFLALENCKVANDNTKSGSSNTNQHFLV